MQKTRRSAWLRVCGLAPWLAAAVAGCGADPAAPHYPPFHGSETESWLAYEVQVPDREPEDLLRSFEASAKNHSCATEMLGRRSEPVIGGELRHWYGISASCDEGTIALVTAAGERVRIGCAKPTTRERCDLLLARISDAK